MDKVYDIPLTQVTRSTDPAVIARGKHLVESIGACGAKDCHGSALSGGNTLNIGPLLTMSAPNITPNGMGAVYNDAELFRLVRHGIKKDGRSLRFMPAHEISWMADADLTAIISYVRTVPGVDKPNGPMEIKTLGKFLDRKEQIIIDVARKIDHGPHKDPPPPAPTVDYGSYIGKLCTGCHGEHLSGGPIPGAPASMAVPLNLTPHETGLKGWTYEDFDKLVTTGIRKNGQMVAKMMPIENLAKMDETEKKALYAYLMSLAPLPFGGR
jgi:mono/diheme cytochrome c family protein